MLDAKKNLLEQYNSFLNDNSNINLNENLNILNNFVRDFPIDELSSISLDEYVIGKQNENSFCHRLERGDTYTLGSVRGGTAKKFGIYCSLSNGEYIYTNKFESQQDAIDRISDILHRVAKTKSLSKINLLIDSDIISPMIIRKVFFMYNPDKLIPIFSTKLLSFFIDKIFGISGIDYVDAQRNLLEIYNSVKHNGKSTCNFMVFIHKYTESQDLLLNTVGENISLIENEAEEYDITAEESNCDSLRGVLMQLKNLKETDKEIKTLTRKEQAFLKKYLFENNSMFKCACCNNDFPVSSLITAHIKKRSKCDIEERTNYNVVMPMCKFGCDEVFEKGYIFINNEGIIELTGKKPTSIFIENFLKIIEGNTCQSYNKKNKQYFEWHKEFHLKD